MSDLQNIHTTCKDPPTICHSNETIFHYGEILYTLTLNLLARQLKGDH